RRSVPGVGRDAAGGQAADLPEGRRHSRAPRRRGRRAPRDRDRCDLRLRDVPAPLRAGPAPPVGRDPVHAARPGDPVRQPGEAGDGIRRPAGVVGAIAPWNAALILSARSIAAPLALGNTVVLKPSELSPVVGGLLWGEIFAEAGLPSGVLNIVTHAPGEAAPIGDELIENPL